MRIFKKITVSLFPSGKPIARNTGWNLIGEAFPLLMAFLALPLLVRGLGTERFGLLSLVWAAVGYFSLLDMGIGRALTKLVAEHLGAGKMGKIPGLIGSFLCLMGAVGTVGVLILLEGSSWLIEHGLHIPGALQKDAENIFWILSASLPVLICSGGLRGVLEAFQRFGLLAAVRIFLGLMIFLAPLIVLHLFDSLVAVSAAIIVVRISACFIYLGCCCRIVPGIRKAFIPDWENLSSLLRYGTWMTVSNIISPLMVVMDRFFIGAWVSLAAVAYYATPMEIVSKLSLIPAAFIGVLFPVFSTCFAESEENVRHLFNQAMKCVFLFTYPLVLLIVAFAPEGLSFWLGDDFARASTDILRWMTVGIFLNGLAYVPFSLLQAGGRPDLTARVHLLEFPVYLLAFWWATTTFGVMGAVAVMFARMAADFLCFYLLARRRLRMGLVPIEHLLALGLGLGGMAVVSIPGLKARFVVFALVVTLHALTAWRLCQKSPETGPTDNVPAGPGKVWKAFFRAH